LNYLQGASVDIPIEMDANRWTTPFIVRRMIVGRRFFKETTRTGIDHANLYGEGVKLDWRVFFVKPEKIELLKCFFGDNKINKEKVPNKIKSRNFVEILNFSSTKCLKHDPPAPKNRDVAVLRSKLFERSAL
jgi:hypothetical protein